MNRILLKTGAILAGIVLVCSLIGVGVGLSLPSEKTKEVTLVNYSHQGEFSYKGYSTSNLFTSETAQPNPTLFPQIIEEMEILFSSSGIEGDTNMKLILEDKNRAWQKEIPVKTAGSSSVSFPFNWKEIILLGETLNAELRGEDLGKLIKPSEEELAELSEEELAELSELKEEKLKETLLGRGSVFQLKIIAETGRGSNLLVVTLEGDLSSSALKWKEEGFNKIERGFPRDDDWRQGAFGYRVKLKENELFGPITLERKPELPTVEAIAPDFTLFTNLVASLDVGFNYRFNANTQINSLEQKTEAWVVIEEPGRWKKTFTLSVPAKAQGEIALSFPFDIGGLQEMAAAVNKKIDGRGAKELEITIFTRVHTVARTDSGTIDEVFNHQLTGKIGETIEFGKDLISAKEGKITEIITEFNPVTQQLQKTSFIVLGVSFVAFCVLAYFYWKRRPAPSFLKEELKRNRKKYKDLISEVTKLPATGEGETIIDTSSLEALVNISNNSLKPVLLKVEPEKHTYWVADGSTRYRYVVKEE